MEYKCKGWSNLVTSIKEKPAAALPYGIIKRVYQSSLLCTGCLKYVSCATGDPSNKNLGFVPPSDAVFKLELIIFGILGIINGGTNPHISSPAL